MGTSPHDGVYTRLRPSKIHGVGVFAIRQIKKGQQIFAHDDAPLVWVNYDRIKNLPRPIKQLYRDFAIIKQGRFGAPKHFDELTTSWYLNHSDSPNVGIDQSFRFYALRTIKVGEELTVDYRTYSDIPKGSLPPESAKKLKGSTKRPPHGKHTA
jgi:SET domain-containing protein